MRLPTLRFRNQFDQAFEHGDSCRVDGIRLVAAENGLEHNRFGFIITTKVGNAVTRNRVRRWARELFSAWANRLKPGHDLVLLVHRREAADDFTGFKSHLGQACRKLRLAGVLDV